jgi:hypothetical protein
MSARKGRAKGQQSTRCDHVVDEGGWTLGQVILWIKTLNIELVRLVKTESDAGHYFHYPATPTMRGYDPEYPTYKEGESDEEWHQRIRAYRQTRFERERPIIDKARHEFLQALRVGQVTAIDKSGPEISLSRWQVIDLSSEEAIKVFLYPSSVVRKLWPEPAPGKPTDQQVKNLVSEIYAVSGDCPKPKQESVRHDVRKRLPGATFRQINVALASVSKKFKNPMGRPKKIKTEN